jgi:hypothetical protein
MQVTTQNEKKDIMAATKLYMGAAWHLPKESLAERIRHAMKLKPCPLLFV